MTNNFSSEVLNDVADEVRADSHEILDNVVGSEADEDIRISNLRQLRLSWNESQTKFWSRFGVTQSRGSRFEKGIGIPNSVAMLMDLYLEQKVNDTDLLQARYISDQPKELVSKVNHVINKNREHRA